MKKTNKKGFTLVELVIVIAVIAILAAVLIPTFTSVITAANKSAAMQEARADWDNFLVDLDYTDADEVKLATSSFVITKGGYFFAVKAGQFSSTVYTSAEAAANAAKADTVTLTTPFTLKDTVPSESGDYFVQLQGTEQPDNFYLYTKV